MSWPWPTSDLAGVVARSPSWASLSLSLRQAIPAVRGGPFVVTTTGNAPGDVVWTATSVEETPLVSLTLFGLKPDDWQIEADAGWSVERVDGVWRVAGLGEPPVSWRIRGLPRGWRALIEIEDQAGRREILGPVCGSPSLTLR